VSTSTVDTWQTVNFKTEKVSEVSNEFLPLILIPPLIEMKTLVLNLKRIMLHIIPLSSFCPPKIDVAFKITIEFMIDHYWILIQW
jgi:hypothetical protein